MDGAHNGLTLEGLAHRLEALERENERMRSENAELQGKVAALESSGAYRDGVAELKDSRAHDGAGREEPASESSGPEEGLMSRRSLLSKAGAAAAGLVVAGALTQRDIREAKAAIVSGTTNTANRGAVEGTNESLNGYGVYGNSRHTGVYGRGNLYGLRGWSPVIGVHGVGDTGVYGQTSAESRAGVYGYHRADGFGVVGEGGPGYAGVKGHIRDGFGYGVYGVGHPGVRGDSSSGSGVEGSAGASGTDGVQGVAQASTRAGVSGINYNGYGGYFFGGKAPLKLAFAGGGVTGRPTTGAHEAGEIYMDSRCTLFVCTAGGTPGTWRRVDTTAT